MSLRHSVRYVGAYLDCGIKSDSEQTWMSPTHLTAPLCVCYMDIFTNVSHNLTVGLRHLPHFTIGASSTIIQCNSLVGTHSSIHHKTKCGVQLIAHNLAAARLRLLNLCDTNTKKTTVTMQNMGVS